MVSDTFRRVDLDPRPVRMELRQLRPLLVLAGVVLVAAILYWARIVLIPVAIATLITFLLTPVVTVLQRRGLARSIAVLLVVIMAFSVLGGVGWVVTTQVWTLAEELPRYRGNIRQKVADLRGVGRTTALGRLQRLIDEVAGEIKKDEPAPGQKRKQEPTPVTVVSDGGALVRQVPALLELLVSAGLVVALVVFMLLRQAEARNRLIRLVGGRRLPATTRALDEAGERISHYLTMQCAINGSFGAAVGLGLYLIGLPYAILWGFLAGVLRFVPYVGVWLAALLPLTLALAVFPGWRGPLLVLGLFLLLEPLIFLVLEPFLYGTSAGVSDVALLIAVGFWAWLWGPVGLILATPLTVCLVVLGKYVPALSFLVVLMGDEPALPPHLQYYQRLLAEDEDEAADIVDEYVKTHTLEQLYDGLLIPVLTTLKHDRARGALGEDDAEFVITRTREIVEDLGLRQASEPLRLAEGAPVRILGCPARDQADELALVMLGQLLEGSDLTLQVLSPRMLAAEMLTFAKEARPALVCVAVLPPGGLAHARYLVKRLRAALPEARILVGRWAGNGETRDVRADLLAVGANDVAATLGETRDRALGLIPVVAEAVGGMEGRARSA